LPSLGCELRIAPPRLTSMNKDAGRQTKAFLDRRWRRRKELCRSFVIPRRHGTPRRWSSGIFAISSRSPKRAA
jgi:hypothetical protein